MNKVKRRNLVSEKYNLKDYVQNAYVMQSFHISNVSNITFQKLKQKLCKFMKI